MDSEMLCQFYRCYASEIYLYLYSLCKNRELAEDLMQEVFLKALLSLSDAHTNMRAWLYKVARNTCLNELRRTNRDIRKLRRNWAIPVQPLPASNFPRYRFV